MYIPLTLPGRHGRLHRQAQYVISALHHITPRYVDNSDAGLATKQTGV